MAKAATAKKCTQCKNPAMEDRAICSDCHAENMREYRAQENKKRDEVTHQKGLEEGVRKCVRFLREQVGSKAVDGFTAAHLVERGCRSSEAPGVKERAALIDSMRPWR